MRVWPRLVRPAGTARRGMLGARTTIAPPGVTTRVPLTLSCRASCSSPRFGVIHSCVRSEATCAATSRERTRTRHGQAFNPVSGFLPMAASLTGSSRRSRLDPRSVTFGSAPVWPAVLRRVMRDTRPPGDLRQRVSVADLMYRLRPPHCGWRFMLAFASLTAYRLIC